MKPKISKYLSKKLMTFVKEPVYWEGSSLLIASKVSGGIATKNNSEKKERIQNKKTEKVYTITNKKKTSTTNSQNYVNYTHYNKECDETTTLT
jgi:hypothetical protein